MDPARVRFTSRLRLEPVGPRHAESVWRLFQDPAVAAWFGVWTLEKPGGEADRMAGRWVTDGVHTWTAYDRLTGDLIGRGGLSRVQQEGRHRLESGASRGSSPEATIAADSSLRSYCAPRRKISTAKANRRTPPPRIAERAALPIRSPAPRCCLAQATSTTTVQTRIKCATAKGLVKSEARSGLCCAPLAELCVLSHLHNVRTITACPVPARAVVGLSALQILRLAPRVMKKRPHVTRLVRG